MNSPFTRSLAPAWECCPRRSASSGLGGIRTQSVPHGIPTEDRGNESSFPSAEEFFLFDFLLRRPRLRDRLDRLLMDAAVTGEDLQSVKVIGFAVETGDVASRLADEDDSG